MSYEAWRISYQSSEQAARAAYSGLQSTSTRLHEVAVACANAEAERDALRLAVRHEADCVDAAKAEIEALRAKIEAMEQQKPARLVTPTAYRWRYRGAVKWQYGELTEEVARLAKEHNHEVQALGILPGAQTQPAPSVPDGFSREDLEAVADGLDGYEKTVNVGNVTGEGDDHLESTTAYAARFIRAMLAATPETKP